jgi:AcrR family transcriptional regulator
MQITPRKLPRQARAKATVEAIVEATTQVLLERGYERFTTAQAAERAGVSVGSLYQYFPNKAALAAAVIDRCCDDMVVAFEDALASRKAESGRPRALLADCVRAMVDVTLVSHRLTSDLHRMVRDLAPRLGVAKRTEMVSDAMTRLIESVLRRHADEIAPDVDLPVAAAIIQTLVESLAHRAALGRAPSGEAALADEAARMITRYLERSR